MRGLKHPTGSDVRTSALYYFSHVCKLLLKIFSPLGTFFFLTDLWMEGVIYCTDCKTLWENLSWAMKTKFT